MPQSIESTLDSYTRPAKLVQTLPDGRLQCLACAHMCKLAEGRRGICKVRVHRGGVLLAPWGYVAGIQPDPVEKKPFFHLLPGATALTFGMLGCNFHCDNCQNWFTSQVLRDDASAGAVNAMRQFRPSDVAVVAKQCEASLLVSSYNEPFITTEWAAELFDAAKANAMRTAVVSNGYASAQSLRYLAPRLDAIKVDLKSADDKEYRKLGGVLANVLQTIDQALVLGLWLEIVSLVIPGLNDSNEALFAMASTVRHRSPDIPWHVTAFYPKYRSGNVPATSAQTLLRAAEIGQEAGLHYVYAGNLPGKVGEYEDTRCAKCGRVVVSRRGYEVRRRGMGADGKCECGNIVPGIWG